MIHAIMNWSGGKDSAMALYRALQTKSYSIDYLLTTVTEPYRRVSMHGIREILLDRQSESISIPVQKVYLSEQSSMEEYEQHMKSTLTACLRQGITHSIFGDVFLEDLRDYRNHQLSTLGMKGVYPIWKEHTANLAKEFIGNGFQAIIVCIDERYLDTSFIGRQFDASFLNDLPKNVDPGGENGEFHTFVFDGPLFRNAIDYDIGEISYRKYENSTFQTGFWYLDLIGK